MNSTYQTRGTMWKNVVFQFFFDQFNMLFLSSLDQLSFTLNIEKFILNYFNTIYLRSTAFLSKAGVDVNLIAVNWEKSSQTINYIAARNRVESIGAHVAAMIDYMVNNDLVSISDISLIGFSLGAHIAGIGKYASPL